MSKTREKQNHIGSLLLVFLIICFLLTSCGAENDSDSSDSAAGKIDISSQMEAAGDFLYYKMSSSTDSFFGKEWIIIGLTRGEYNINQRISQKYYEDIKAELKKRNGVLDKTKYTTYSRVILALTMMGKDATNIEGYDLTEFLCDWNKVVYQGINGPIWALIAMDSGKYDFPESTGINEVSTREKMIDYILSNKLAEGGWSFTGNEVDVDITAMAIQALAPYVVSNQDVKKAVEEGILTLSNLQQDDGGFSSWGKENSESCAQVIVALSTMNIDAGGDKRFVKNGNSVLDALLSFQEDGGFKHEADACVDGIASEQGYYGLVSYWRFVQGKSSLYQIN